MSEEWSDDELRVCVRQYWKALKNKGDQREIDRAVFAKGALEGSLKARGIGAIQRRMCNISAVLEQNNKSWVIGWNPLRNVGAGVTPRIEALLREFELL